MSIRRPARAVVIAVAAAESRRRIMICGHTALAALLLAALAFLLP